MTKSRYESLQEHKRPYAHDHPPAEDLLSAVKVIRRPHFFLSLIMYVRIISGVRVSLLDFHRYQIHNCFIIRNLCCPGLEAYRVNWNLWKGGNFHQGSAGGGFFISGCKFLLLF